MDVEFANEGNGGKELISYGGGGNPSVAVGELVLLRTRELSDGEKSPRGGKSGLLLPLKELCCHG